MVDNNNDEFVGRLKPLTFLIFMVISILIARVGYLQVYDGEYYGKLADGNRIRIWLRAELFLIATDNCS